MSDFLTTPVRDYLQVTISITELSDVMLALEDRHERLMKQYQDTDRRVGELASEPLWQELYKDLMRNYIKEANRIAILIQRLDHDLAEWSMKPSPSLGEEINDQGGQKS